MTKKEKKEIALQRERIHDQFTIAYATMVEHCVTLEKREKWLGITEFVYLNSQTFDTDKMIDKIKAQVAEELTYNPYES